MKHKLKPDTYALARECVEDGVAYGYRRAHKHTDTPTPEAIHAAIVEAIMLELSGRFRWD